MPAQIRPYARLDETGSDSDTTSDTLIKEELPLDVKAVSCSSPIAHNRSCSSQTSCGYRAAHDPSCPTSLDQDGWAAKTATRMPSSMFGLPSSDLTGRRFGRIHPEADLQHVSQNGLLDHLQDSNWRMRSSILMLAALSNELGSKDFQVPQYIQGGLKSCIEMLTGSSVDIQKLREEWVLRDGIDRQLKGDFGDSVVEGEAV